MGEDVNKTLDLIAGQVRAAREKDYVAYMRYGDAQQAATPEMERAVTAYIDYTYKSTDDLITDYNDTYNWFVRIGIVLILVSICIFVTAKRGINNHLIAPMSDALTHLQHLAKADLSQNIVATGKNEMGSLILAMGL